MPSRIARRGPLRGVVARGKTIILATAGDSFYPAVIPIEAVGAGSQALTQSSRFDNTNTLNYSHSISLGTVTLTQSSSFTNDNTFYAHSISQGSPQTLTQSARFDSSNGFYTHALTAGVVALAQSSRFDNSQAFYTHALTPGEVTLTQPAKFDNEQAFYSHNLGLGEVALSQSVTLENANGFFSHEVTISDSETSGGGWAKYAKRSTMAFVRHKGKILLFTNDEEARAWLAAQDAINNAKAEKSPSILRIAPVPIQPMETIRIADIRAKAITYNQDDQVERLIRRNETEALVKLYLRLKQDEEETALAMLLAA